MQGVPDPGSAAAEIEFRAVTKRYPGRTTAAVSELSLNVPAGEICVLIGPSGSGKTTAMKMVNRLIDITDGDITIGGQSVRSLDLTELRRGIGYVFQQIGLFPHMSVEDNIGTVPRLLGWDKKRIRSRVGELLELVGLEQSDAKRYPGQFSGGQRQRIGVARAMAAGQPIMLMDEPFGAVDPIARDRLQSDFLRLHAEVQKTVIFVTHDIDEAIKMGHRIAILRDGELVQYGTPDEILASPANEFIADFVGADRGLKRLLLRELRDIELTLANGEADDAADHRRAHVPARRALDDGHRPGERAHGAGRGRRATGHRVDGDRWPTSPTSTVRHRGRGLAAHARSDRAPDRTKRPGHPDLPAGVELRAREPPVLLGLVLQPLEQHVRAAAHRAHRAHHHRRRHRLRHCVRHRTRGVPLAVGRQPRYGGRSALVYTIPAWPSSSSWCRSPGSRG